MVRIVEAEETHIPQIVNLWVEFFDHHYTIDRFFERSDDAEEKFGKMIGERIDKDDSLVLVAVEDDQVVGYSLSYVTQNPPVVKSMESGFISDLAVTTDYRRRGIGGLLLKETLAWFKSRGLKLVYLRVLAKNEGARAFWKKHGFEVASITMEIDLGGAPRNPHDHSGRLG
jgi:ribosomal protein S18 acetylase RimI-like enzyme